jgi:hypothetical protein
MLYCLALLLRNPFLRYGLFLIVNFLLIYTGFGLFMGIVTIGVCALECYWRFRRILSIPAALPIAALLIAGASLGSYFLRYAFVPAVDCFELPRNNLAAYPKFMAWMFSNFVGLAVPLLATAVGGAILVFAMYLLVVQVRRFLAVDCSRDASLIIGVLLSYGVLYSASTAFGRVCLGPDAAVVSRYATLLIPAFFAFYLYLLSIPSGRGRTIALVIFAALLVPTALRVPPGAHWFADGKRAWVACYLQTENIAHCDQASGFPIYPWPEGTGLRQKLATSKSIGLPSMLTSSPWLPLVAATNDESLPPLCDRMFADSTRSSAARNLAAK